MADEEVVNADNPDVDTSTGEDDPFGGLPEIIAMLQTANDALDAMVPKLVAVGAQLDNVIAKLAQIDVKGGGGEAAPVTPIPVNT
jgi:hypothetical protein